MTGFLIYIGVCFLAMVIPPLLSDILNRRHPFGPYKRDED
jgi:hypothetical protein